MREFLAGQPLADHWFVWGGDGRITAGHLAVLAERAAAGPLELILFDGVTGEGWSWSQRDEAMARRLLAATGLGTRTLAVAGNAHTPVSPTEPGIPMGARLAAQRPGVREIRISYGGGGFYNGGPRQFARRAGPQDKPRLYQSDGELVLDLHLATEAVVPTGRSRLHPCASQANRGMSTAGSRGQRPHDLASAVLRMYEYCCLGRQSLGRVSPPAGEVASEDADRISAGFSGKRAAEKIYPPA